MVQHLLGNLDRGLLFVLSAPAGTGKTTLVERLVQEFPKITRSVSFTTRQKRLGEVNGQDYWFVDRAWFEKLVKESAFLEYAEVFGNFYGTPKSQVEEARASGQHVILVIDTKGGMTLRLKEEAIFIFVRPPSEKDLRERLHKRQTDSLETVEHRLSLAGKELQESEGYDYQIVNDDLEVAYAVLKSIIIAEEHRTCHFQKSSTKKG